MTIAIPGKAAATGGRAILLGSLVFVAPRRRLLVPVSAVCQGVRLTRPSNTASSYSLINIVPIVALVPILWLARRGWDRRLMMIGPGLGMAGIAILIVGREMPLGVWTAATILTGGSSATYWTFSDPLLAEATPPRGPGTGLRPEVAFLHDRLVGSARCWRESCRICCGPWQVSESATRTGQCCSSWRRSTCPRSVSSRRRPSGRMERAPRFHGRSARPFPRDRRRPGAVRHRGSDFGRRIQHDPPLHLVVPDGGAGSVVRSGGPGDRLDSDVCRGRRALDADAGSSIGNTRAWRSCVWAGSEAVAGWFFVGDVDRDGDRADFLYYGLIDGTSALYPPR